MCGIAGIYYFNNTRVDAASIRRMSDCMAHRGPDADGFFINDKIALGHRRLSIIDLSDAANQPLTAWDNRFQLIFNGELYNFRDVRERIKDHRFRTTGDTEVLVEAFARWGIDCLHHFKGMFAFAIWDDVEKELTIVRDRMGVKPLYYYADKQHFIFASEIRSIVNSGLVKTRINEDALADYLSFQSISSPHTLLDGIKQLEAGHYIKVSNDSFEIKQYWNIAEKEFEANDLDDPKTVQSTIRTLLTKAVETRLISDVPIGAFLSGGIDSSAVVGLMSQVSNGRPNTFNISFDEKDFDESEYAELVAKKFNTVHQRILLKPTAMLDELQNALDALDSPSGDGINTYVVSKAVKKAGLTVALSGIGGDELFAGYPFFKTFYRLQKNRRAWNSSAVLRKMAAPVLSLEGSSRNIKASEILKTDSSEIEHVYSIFRQVLPKAEIRNVLRRNTSSTIPLVNKLHRLAGSLHNFPYLSQVSIAEYIGYTQQTLLKDTDQMAMAVSLEVREPFFDHELIKYVLNVPDKVKYPVYAKSLLVESLGTLLPDEIVHRKKQGFTFPWNHWLRNELRSFCNTHITMLAEREFINGPALLKMWTDFLQGSKRMKWMDIWLFVVLNYWMERNRLN